jgi:nucleoside-diphosphate-sugar epimerase
MADIERDREHWMVSRRCVTGATGFIAGQLTGRLLALDYTVRGTVRNLDSADAGSLRRLPGGDRRLELIEADLLQPGSFDKAVAGCQTVFHVASPFAFTATDPAKDLLAPAVEGTLNVLEACRLAPEVKRVVLTSSIAALVGRPDGRLLTEDNWNTFSSLSDNPYYYAKTQAEQAAWRFMKEARPHFDLVVINPGQVLGPSHRESVGTSIAYVRDLMTGKVPAVINLDVPYVDVRDVADAHILASQTPEAQGRYVTVAGVITTRQLIEAIKRLGYIDYRFPKISLDSSIGMPFARIAIRGQPSGLRHFLRAFVGRRVVFDNSKIRSDLGIEFRPLAETIRDTIEDLAAKHQIPPGAMITN